jgi:hypothetical protein
MEFGPLFNFLGRNALILSRREIRVGCECSHRWSWEASYVCVFDNGVVVIVTLYAASWRFNSFVFVMNRVVLDVVGLR